MKKTLLFILLSLAAVALAEIPFVVGGKETKSYLLLDTNPTPTAQYAAQELAAYIKKITGVEDIYTENGLGKNNWNIVIGYGDRAKQAGLTLDGLKHDGFRLVTKGNTLYIYGVDRPTDRPIIGGNTHLISWKTFNALNNISIFGDSGTLYGVYYLLREYFGVRWFTPGDLGEVVPKNPDFIIPDMDVKVNPDFEYRLDYVTVLNLNNDFAKWYRRAGFGAPLPVEINHTFYKMNKYQKSHPEWFALLKDGRRDFNITCQGEGNLCLSQPGLVDAYAKEAEAYFKAFPDQERFCVMPNDWFNQICECPECQAQIDNDKPIYGKYSNYVWSFVNKVAKRSHRPIQASSSDAAHTTPT